MKLPRGTSGEPMAAPTATAQWAGEDITRSYKYQAGDIYLGDALVMPESAAATVAALDSFIRDLSDDATLEEGWVEQQIAQAQAYREWLMTAERIEIGINDDRHLVSKAGSRSGKGISAIIPNLVRYPGSVLQIDPKGTNARITALRRGKGSKHCKGMGQKVYVLDPYNVSGVPDEFLASYNPIEYLSSNDPEVIDKASSLAQGLIVRGSDEAVHFDDNARSLVKGLILYVVKQGKPEHKSLPYVHTLLTQGAREVLAADRGEGVPASPDDPDPFRYLLLMMEHERAFDGVISGIASTILSMGEREYGSVLSTARRNLEFLERPGIRRVLSSSSFSLDELKTDPKGVSVYLCLPVTRMDDCGRWLRLMIAAAMERIYAIQHQPKCGHPILFLLEEFATLKHMEVIETAAGYAAEFGVKLWAILQDLSQLKRHYKDGWETFLGNASVVQAFGNSDMTTLDYLSRKLGETETTQTTRNTTSSRSVSTNDSGDAARIDALRRNPLSLLADQRGVGESASTTTAYNQQIQRSPLLQTNEIEQLFRREAMTEIVSIKGEPPFALHRSAYFDSPAFAGLFEPDRKPYRTVTEAEKWRADQEMQQAKETARMIKDAGKFVTDARAAIEAARQQGRSR